MNNQKQQKYKIWWNEEEKIIRFQLLAEELEEEAIMEIFKESREITERYGKVNSLVDLSKLKKNISSRARRRVNGILKGNPNINKLAILGASTVIRVGVNFIMAAIGKKDVKFFTTEKEAMKWLKQD